MIQKLTHAALDLWATGFLKFPSLCSNVRLGETILDQDPDCPKCASVQDIEVESTKVHEAWSNSEYFKGNDIALVRLKKPAILFVVLLQYLKYYYSKFQYFR